MNPVNSWSIKHQKLANALVKIEDVDKMKDEATRLAISFDKRFLDDLLKEEDYDICTDFSHTNLPKMWCVVTSAKCGELFEGWALKLIRMFPGCKSPVIITKTNDTSDRLETVEAYIKLVKTNIVDMPVFILPDISDNEAIELSKLQVTSSTSFVIIGGMKSDIPQYISIRVIETMDGVIVIDNDTVHMMKHRYKATNLVTEAVNNIRTINQDDSPTKQQFVERLASFVIESCG